MSWAFDKLDPSAIPPLLLKAGYKVEQIVKF
jgi:hypothetical protein